MKTVIALLAIGVTCASPALAQETPPTPPRPAGAELHGDRIPSESEGYPAWTIRMKVGDGTNPAISINRWNVARIVWEKDGQIWYADSSWATSRINGFSQPVSVSPASSSNPSVASWTDDTVTAVYLTSTTPPANYVGRTVRTAAGWADDEVFMPEMYGPYSNPRVVILDGTTYVFANGPGGILFSTTAGAAPTTIQGTVPNLAAAAGTGRTGGMVGVLWWCLDPYSNVLWNFSRPLAGLLQPWQTVTLPYTGQAYTLSGGSDKFLLRSGDSFTIYADTGTTPLETGTIPSWIDTMAPALIDDFGQITLGQAKRVELSDGARHWGIGPGPEGGFSAYSVAALGSYGVYHVTSVVPDETPWISYSSTYEPNLGWQDASYIVGSAANVSNGNLTIGYKLFEDKGAGLATSFGVTFNSQCRAMTTLGWGWTHSYQYRFVCGGPQQGGLMFPDGSIVGFMYNAEVDAWETRDDGDFVARIYTDQPEVGQLLMRTPQGHKYVLDGFTGFLLREMDPNGNALTLNYDAGGNLATIVDSVGRVTKLEYDWSGKVEYVKRLFGTAEQCQYKLEYGSLGLLNKIIYPGGRTVQFEYAMNSMASLNQMRPVMAWLKHIPPKAVQSLEMYGTWYVFDRQGRIEFVLDPEESSVVGETYEGALPELTMAWMFFYFLPLPQDSPLHWTLVYDRRGYWSQIRSYYPTSTVHEEINPLGHRTVNTFYEKWRKRKTTTTPNGVTWEYVIDEAASMEYPGLVREIKIPGGLSRSFTYTGDGLYNVETERAPDGTVTHYDYDICGNLIAKTYAYGTIDAATEQFEYDAQGNGRLRKATTPEGRYTTYTNDDPFTGLPRTITRSGSTLSDQLTYCLDGAVKIQIGPTGNRVDFEYTVLDQLWKKTETSVLGAPVTEYTYDIEGNPTVEKDANNKTIVSTYDKLGRKTSVTDKMLYTTTTDYDRMGQVRRVTPPGGGVTETLYDEAGRVKRTKSTVWPGTRVIDNYYDERDTLFIGYLTRTVDRGQETTYDYDIRGNKIFTALPDGRTCLRTSFDDLDRPFLEKTVVGGAFQKGTFRRYDKRGRVVEQWSLTTDVPDGERNPDLTTQDLCTTTQYDLDGLVLWTIDPSGRRKGATYTLQGWRSEVLDHNGGVVAKTVYDDSGFVTEQKVLDAATGQLVTVSTFHDNGRGQADKIRDAFNNETNIVFDPVGRVTDTTSPLGRAVKSEYWDDGALRKKQLDPLGLNVMTEYEYNEKRQLTNTRVWNPAAGSYSANYPLGLTYDGQLLTMTYPDNAVESWTYSTTKGLLETHTDLNGIQTTLTYDLLNRVLTDVRGTISSIEYAYHDSGQIKWVRQLAGNTVGIEYLAPNQSPGYDRHGRLTDYRIVVQNEQQQWVIWKRVQIGYDDSSNVRHVTVRSADDMIDQTLEYGYNNDNRLIWVKCNGTEIARYEYFAGGQLKSTLRQGTIRTLNEYDQAQRLVRQTTTDAGGKVICDLGRHYDNDGLVDGEILHHLGASWTHVYDNAGRLTDSTLAGNGGGPPPFTNPYVNEPPTPIVSADSNEASAAPAALTAVPNYAGHWNYDAAGNITSFTENGATWTRTHNSRSQMLTETRDGSTEHYGYTYDPQGNQTKEEFTPAGWATPREIKTRGYGAFNEIGTFVLQTRSTDGGQLTNVTSYQYYYRPDGVRWGKEDLLASTNQCEWFVSVSSNILTEYRQSVGQGYELKAANVPGLGIDEHIARVDVLDGNSIALYLNNAIGSTHQMVRSTGTVLNQDMTTPWGKNLPGYSWTDAVPNRYGLTGQERDRETATTSDPTGEMHYRARGYSPRQMRFLQNDPPVGRRAEKHYVYVSNNPVSLTDPSGAGPGIALLYDDAGASSPDTSVAIDAAVSDQVKSPAAAVTDQAKPYRGPMQLRGCTSCHGNSEEARYNLEVSRDASGNIFRHGIEVLDMVRPAPDQTSQAAYAQGEIIFSEEATTGERVAAVSGAVGFAILTGIEVVDIIPDPSDPIVRVLTKEALEQAASRRAGKEVALKRGVPDLPVLDSTGKVHGELPKPKDLGSYDVEELKRLQDELNASVKKRIEKTVEKGSDPAHGDRLAAEQQLIQSIEKHLGDRR